jgi:hypothetical protein
MPPLYKASKRTETRLRDLLAANVPIWRIAEVLDCPENTLRRHYPSVFSDIARALGIKPFIPSPEQRAKVKLLASLGVTQVDIAKVIGISHNTVVDNFREELDIGPIDANSKVAAKIFSMAMGPPDGKNTFLAAKFWASARMSWSDRVAQELTGANGGPIRLDNQVVVILPDNGRSHDIDLDAEDADEVETDVPSALRYAQKA